MPHPLSRVHSESSLCRAMKCHNSFYHRMVYISLRLVDTIPWVEWEDTSFVACNGDASPLFCMLDANSQIPLERSFTMHMIIHLITVLVESFPIFSSIPLSVHHPLK